MSSAVKKIRLDQALVDQGLSESREKAQRAILAGQVWIQGQRASKASQTVLPTAALEVRGGDRYVSRGGHKLEGALLHFGIDPAGLRCLDVGASTGGFTDCLLQAGAARVVALDVGNGQLHWKLRQDPRVEVHEGVNARALDVGLFAAPFEPFDLAVVDVSFISLKLVLPPIFPLLRPGGRVVALIKPQFEAGRSEVGKGGIVRDEAVRTHVIATLQEWLQSHPYPVEDRGIVPSSLKGTDGNQEYLWAIAKTR